ncbi:M15 family metallopeptidase [Haliscomenobacter hydrossis]|uniref:Peptidase M15C domain-containing protein n=1 Tax=Haliscomenobacter hydrossis (strain ATCC 27775 / DSM 1100 / LMG 10767 / O) TaxID=760192 RepID=F4KVB2_HALH1|nr:M15 family metallopeptidase [Haliscomenobacter hydrossis]AEE50238.1 hypothetical protein Halhy_2362 [Haliscomenobacter hydrossis DSM 1100]
MPKILLLLLIFLSLNTCNKNIPTGKSSAEPGFAVLNIDEKLEQELRAKNVFGPLSPVPLNRLRLVRVKHFGFDDQEHTGELIVLDACAERVKLIFQDLFALKFPIEKIRLITAYNGDDGQSMADNNTSAHNLRAVTGGTSLSLHAYGTAIDLNPKINPYVAINATTGVATFQPIEGIKYANRMLDRLGKTRRKGFAEEIVEVFARHGFYGWGGYWDTPIDYQHFQLSRSVSEILVLMDPLTAANFFTQTVQFYKQHKRAIEDELDKKKAALGFKDKSMVTFYQEDPQRFLNLIKSI